MSTTPGEADLRKAGRRKIATSCLMWGLPLLVIFAVAGMQYAGAIRLEEYFAQPPNEVEPRVVWTILGVIGVLQFLFLTLGIFQGWNALRRAKQLRRPA